MRRWLRPPSAPFAASIPPARSEIPRATKSATPRLYPDPSPLPPVLQKRLAARNKPADCCPRQSRAAFFLESLQIRRRHLELERITELARPLNNSFSLHRRAADAGFQNGDGFCVQASAMCQRPLLQGPMRFLRQTFDCDRYHTATITQPF